MAPSPPLWFAGKDCPSRLSPTTAPSVGEKCAQWRIALALLTAIVVSHLKAKLGWCQLAAGVDFQFAKRLSVSDISLCQNVSLLFLFGVVVPIFISAIMCKCQVHTPWSPCRQESHFLQFCHQRLWKSRTLAGGTVLTAGPFRWGVGWSTQRDSKTGHQDSKATWHDPNLTPA